MELSGLLHHCSNTKAAYSFPGPIQDGMFTLEALKSMESFYLGDLLLSYHLVHPLKSSKGDLHWILPLKEISGMAAWGRAFSLLAPLLWSSLPCTLRTSSKLLGFWERLKSFFLISVSFLIAEILLQCKQAKSYMLHFTHALPSFHLVHYSNNSFILILCENFKIIGSCFHFFRKVTYMFLK